MKRLSVARIATDTPMGAQAYQAQIISRAPSALGPDWSVRELVFRSLRSPLPGNRRLPLGRVTSAPASVRREIGRMLFAGDTVSHRMSLELPPSPHADVITLHDVVAWRFADESAPVPAAVDEARRAAAVICVSEFTAREAAEFLGVQDPLVVPNGVDPRYYDAEPADAAALALLGLRGPYVLHAGGAAERKNLAALASAWPLVHRERPDLTLALAGPPHPRRTALFDGMPGTVMLGRLPDETMPGLVAAASVVVVPSLYEGFGLPALEAMAAGVPVVAASTSSLPEVVGAAGILVAPTAEGIVDGLLQATSGDAAVAALIAAGRARAAEFTWERSAAGHARVWNSVGL
ncbi:glycosyltransferase family 1 protein [Microbacterium bovistercoris]|uniref:Glycosyltransferase family 1 protein n=1 Tax=Microbacterium bovistercoris TaxID=2293570 RepID=A0A371NXJ2_9MICO|nr:glycosyltransferase family 1 protein [Microbacterium bovistercoris]REJ08030.1 glycosyltransferase family 1 protein [Microbacterium bovistercoris]